MAGKTSSLQAVLDAKARQANDVEEALTPAETPKPETKSKKKKKSKVKPSRESTTLIGGHFPPEVSKQLAIIAAEEGATKQALLTEALDMLFVKKGKAKIVDL